jgi:chromosome segregation ATPase
MSYDPKYRKWVEKQTKQHLAAGMSESNKLVEVYRGIPIFQEKVKNDPPEYRFRAPRARSRKIERLHEKLDKHLDTTPNTSLENQDSEGSYRQKYENCQIELKDMKRREARRLSDLEKIQGKVDELNASVVRLQKEADDLRSQLKESKAIIKEYNKK